VNNIQKASFGITDKCDRCRLKAEFVIMSRFNIQMICPKCEAKEKAHPMYKEAKDRELAEVRHGNYNFPGIGLPADL